MPDFKSPAAGAVLVVALCFAGIAASGLGRAGYSIDEEYTVFGVRGIASHGVPILPSGALHDRGLPYTYAAWVSGVVFGHGLPAYRLPSLLSAIVAIVLAFRLARLAQGTFGAALVATITVAALPWMIFSAQWARFYAMFAAVLLGSLLIFLRYQRTGRGLWAWLASIWFAHLLHEFTILLVLLPAVAWMLEDRRRRHGAFPLRTTVLALSAFALSEATVFVLHFTVSGIPFRTLHDYAALHTLPVGWETPLGPDAPEPAYPLFEAGRWARLLAVLPVAILGAVLGALAASRFGVSRLLGAAQGALAAFGQFSRLWLLGALSVFARPGAALRTSIWTAALVVLAAVILAVETSRRSGATLSFPLISGLVLFAFREALSSISGLILNYPASAACLAAAAAIVSIRFRSASALRSRFLLLWVLWWMVAFDLLAVDFKPRYYAPFWPLFAVAVISAARFVPVTWFRRRSLAVAARLAIAVVAAAIVAWEQYHATDENRTSRCFANGTVCVPMMLTYDTSPVAAIRDRVREGDAVLCSDELLCHLELGRVDYFLYAGTIFRHAAPGGPIGLYGGAPIVSSLDDLHALLSRDPLRRFWIVVPALSKYATWPVDDIVRSIPEPQRGRTQVIRTAGATIVGPS